MLSIKELEKQGLLISKSQEQEYCKENGLKLFRLENGTKIISAHKEITDENTASLNFHLSLGSYLDPIKKDGLHHLLEHMFFSRETSDVYMDNFVNFNANTSVNKVKFMLSGIYNKMYSNFGMPYVLEDAYKSVFKSKRIYQLEEFQNEKKIVNEEIAIKQNDLYTQSAEFHKGVLLPNTNPFSKNVIGSQSSLESISHSDIIETYETKVTPKNTVVSVAGRGFKNEGDEICEQLNNMFVDDKNYGEKYTINSKDGQKFNKYDPQIIYKNVTDQTPRGVVHTSITWVLTHNSYTIENIAMSLVWEYLGGKIFLDTREAGIAYNTSSDWTNTSMDSRILTFDMYTGNEDIGTKQKVFLDIIAKNINDSISNSSNLERRLEMEKIRQLATPIQIESLLNNALGGIIEYDRITSIAAYQAQYNDLTQDHLIFALKQLDIEKSLKVMVGDF